MHKVPRFCHCSKWRTMVWVGLLDMKGYVMPCNKQVQNVCQSQEKSIAHLSCMSIKGRWATMVHVLSLRDSGRHRLHQTQTPPSSCGAGERAGYVWWVTLWPLKASAHFISSHHGTEQSKSPGHREVRPYCVPERRKTGIFVDSLSPPSLPRTSDFKVINLSSMKFTLSCILWLPQCLSSGWTSPGSLG